MLSTLGSIASQGNEVLLIHTPFDNNLDDIGEGSTSVTINGATTYGAGQFNNAIRMYHYKWDIPSNFIDYVPSKNLDVYNNPFTVSFWIRISGHSVSALSLSPSIVVKNKSNQVQYSFFSGDLRNSGVIGSVDNFQLNINNKRYTFSGFGLTLNQNTWHYMKVWYDGASASMQINSTIKAGTQASQTDSMATTLNLLRLGFFSVDSAGNQVGTNHIDNFKFLYGIADKSTAIPTTP